MTPIARIKDFNTSRGPIMSSMPRSSTVYRYTYISVTECSLHTKVRRLLNVPIRVTHSTVSRRELATQYMQ